MKKYFYFLSLLFIITSCTEDVKFNNPAFQTLKDNVFWRAQTYKAYLTTNGNLLIEGSLGFEKITLQMVSPAQQTYVLGVDDVTKGSYSNTLPGQTASFTTGTNKGSGQIIVTDYNIETNTVSGTFKFNAVNEDATDTENPKITFTEGVFYKVPVTPTLEY
ncbi:hypothetical protein IRZ83_07645 [Flavobacterium sp. JLP]|uniref:DUF6252 family protein n=1 Tax=unclassified Flavobacterium TaxID=196869 RepID=UPI00049305E3|nr:MULTISPECIES: DUF6252 family protein [unclassified Flavobacterium]MBF4506540.1 hypothetical protein [Flavobacterium sp. JLP]